MKLKELYNKQKELEKEIEYEEKKQSVCAYGKEDLYYLDGLYAELEEIKEQIEIKEGGII
jgi:hypothetical protein